MAGKLKIQTNISLEDLIMSLANSLSISENLNLDDSTKEELPAAISHWLWNPSELPPMFSPAIKSEAIQFLKEKYPETLTEKKEFRCQTIGFDAIPYPPPKSPEFRFIDLFAGIGGFRIAFQNQGGKCVFTSEWDRFAKQTYEHNFGEIPYGDINRIDPMEIPDHEVLCAGFPCQPFSLAGVSKNVSLGRKHGFEHAAQGTLFFNICKVIEAKRPKAFFLENVKNLKSHDDKKTFTTIMKSLRDDLGYIVNERVVDGGNWVPQHRERIFIVGFDPKQTNIRESEEIIIPSKPDVEYKLKELSDVVVKKVNDRYTLGLGTWNTLIRHKKKHAAAGNGFGYGLHDEIKAGDRTRTISARYHKDGAEILINQPGTKRPRRLTPDEAKQLQGYDLERFQFPVSDTQAYRQIGNSVVVPAVEATAQELIKALKEGNK